MARKWDQQETDWAASMKVRYLFVDRRLALELPHFGSYFYNGETGMNEQLTEEQLNKFDHIRGIKEIYRHGPISIYDLKALGIPELRSGWFKATPVVALSTQLAVGLSCGLFIALLVRSRAWPRIKENARDLKAGMGPGTDRCSAVRQRIADNDRAAVGTRLGYPAHHVDSNPGRGAHQFSGDQGPRAARDKPGDAPGVRTALAIAVPFTIIAGVAILDAATVNIFGVEKVLNDPTAIHIPFEGPKVGAPT